MAQQLRLGVWHQLPRSRCLASFHCGERSEWKIRIGQFAPLNKAGNALRCTSNRHGVIQVEIGAKAASPFTTHGKAITAAVRSLFRAVREFQDAGLLVFVGAEITTALVAVRTEPQLVSDLPSGRSEMPKVLWGMA